MQRKRGRVRQILKTLHSRTKQAPNINSDIPCNCRRTRPCPVRLVNVPENVEFRLPFHTTDRMQKINAAGTIPATAQIAKPDWRSMSNQNINGAVLRNFGPSGAALSTSLEVEGPVVKFRLPWTAVNCVSAARADQRSVTVNKPLSRTKTHSLTGCMSRTLPP